jgi:CubicO group peptidase (beta-lactamase class C family)
MRRQLRIVGIAVLAIALIGAIVRRAFWFDFETEPRSAIDPHVAANERSTAVVAPANDLLDRYAAVSNFSGIVLIAFGDDIALTRTFGDVHDAQTRMTFGSVAKSLTGFMIHRLVDQGVLTLDARVDAVVPELAGAPVGAATVHQLLRMTSGLPVTFGAWSQFRVQAFDRWMSDEEAVDQIRKLPLAFAPGTDFLYSNVGYRLLAVIATRITGKSFPGLMNEHVFAPAGMVGAGIFQAGVDPPAEMPAGHIPFRCYLLFGPPCMVQLPHWNYSALWGAGATYARARDFVAWSRWLRRVVTNEPVLFARYVWVDKENYASGIGNQELALPDSSKVRVFSHGGEDPGYEAFFAWIPSFDATLIVMSDSDYGYTGSYRLGTELRALIAGAPYRVVRR